MSSPLFAAIFWISALAPTPALAQVHSIPYATCALGNGRWFSASVSMDRNPEFLLFSADQPVVHLGEASKLPRLRESFPQQILCQDSHVLMMNSEGRTGDTCLFRFELFSMEKILTGDASADLDRIQLPKFAQFVPGPCDHNPQILPIDLPRGRFVIFGHSEKETRSKETSRDWYEHRGSQTRVAFEVDLFKESVQTLSKIHEAWERSSQYSSINDESKPRKLSRPLAAKGGYYIAGVTKKGWLEMYPRLRWDLWDLNQDQPLLEDITHDPIGAAIDPKEKRVAVFGSRPIRLRDYPFHDTKYTLEVSKFDAHNSSRTERVEVEIDALRKGLNTIINDRRFKPAMEFGNDGGLYLVYRPVRVVTYGMAVQEVRTMLETLVVRFDLKTRSFRVLGEHCAPNNGATLFSKSSIARSRKQYDEPKATDYILDGADPKGLLVRSDRCTEFWPMTGGAP